MYEKTSLGDCFALCKRERRHLLVVVEKISKSLCGIVTTEDILEEILQDEIVGDDDQYIDQEHVVDAAGPRAPELEGLRSSRALRSLSPAMARALPSRAAGRHPEGGPSSCRSFRSMARPRGAARSAPCPRSSSRPRRVLRVSQLILERGVIRPRECP